MNVKDDLKKTKKMNVMSLLFGGGVPSEYDYDSSLKYYTISATIVLWFIAIVFAFGLHFHNSNSSNIYEYLSNAIIISSIGGMIIAALSVIGESDWHRKYGNGIFFRVVIYNFLVFFIMTWVDKSNTSELLREPIKESEFFITDVDKCRYKIIMKSEHLEYISCDDYDTLYKSLINQQTVDGVLVGSLKYNNKNADHVEFITNKIISK